MNITLKMIADVELLREAVDLECKLAGGRDGFGAVPHDFWKTYSAFANTEGGIVLLGMREKKGAFSVEGIKNVAKVRQELFDLAHNRQKVSACLLTDEHVQEVELEGRMILAVEIPRAPRKQQPVYLNSNPLGNTYRRRNEGDRVLADDDVKRMLAEQVEDSRDNRILKGFDFDDLDLESFHAYRQVFANREPGHIWNTMDDREFLRLIGGWRKDRETDESGLTVAGLLMFGQMVSIQEELPNYMLDYQERPATRTESRWVDRITLDGKWSGNLYDFYRKVYLKLTAELKVPFVLEKGERKDETPVHVALREALANVIVHADYSERASVLVVKRPDMFGFRNPGLMRIPIEVALHGGEPDCRNRMLHKMFRFVGVGEQSGMGIPKILAGWRSQHWSLPKLYDTSEPYNQTLLELRMIDLFPDEVMAGLKASFDDAFERLSYVERVALALASSEGTVNHARLQTVTSEHSVDLSKMLQHLVSLGMLQSTGGRGAVYHLPGEELPRPEDVFGVPVQFGSASFGSVQFGSSSPDLGSSSPDLGSRSPDLRSRDADGCLLSPHLILPIIDNLEILTPQFRNLLEEVARSPREKKKVGRDVLISVVLDLCDGHFITLRCLSELVDRQPKSLRESYLSGLVRDRKLSLAFPTTPTHERQAYCTSSSLPESETE